VTETTSPPSGPRFTEFLAWVFFFGVATLSAAARLLGGQNGWSSRYDDTLILAVSSVFWIVCIIEIVSGVFLLVRRRFGWARVAVAASFIPSLGSLLVIVVNVVEGGLGGEWMQIAFFILPFPVLFCSLLSLKRNRRVPSARGAAISAVLLVAVIIAGFFGLSRREYHNYSCRACGAYREVRERLEPYFLSRITLYEDKVYPTPLSTLIDRHQLLATAHPHSWMHGETPTSIGGAAGWKKEAEDPRVIAFVDSLFLYRGSAKAVWGTRLALKIQTFRTPLSKVLEQDSFPKSGFPSKDEFDEWMARYESQLEKQLAKSR